MNNYKKYQNTITAIYVILILLTLLLTTYLYGKLYQ